MISSIKVMTLRLGINQAQVTEEGLLKRAGVDSMEAMTEDLYSRSLTWLVCMARRQREWPPLK